MSRESDRLVRQAQHEKQDYPFEPIPTEDIVLVEKAIRDAWGTLKRNPEPWEADLEKDDEPFISDPLLRVLNFLRDNASHPPYPALRKRFRRITQNSSYRNYRGNRLKSPDLIFTPKHCPTPGLYAEYYAYFVEAKVINTLGTASQSVGLYLDKGVRRFVEGDYAWTMTHGGMIAYVRDGHEVRAAIEGHIRLIGNRQKWCLKSDPCWARPPNPKPKALNTCHRRSFEYNDDQDGSPGDIEIRHLWLEI